MTETVLHIGPNIRLFSRHYQDKTSSEGMKLDNMEQSSPLNKQMERNCESEDSAFLSAAAAVSQKQHRSHRIFPSPSFLPMEVREKASK